MGTNTNSIATWDDLKTGFSGKINVPSTATLTVCPCRGQITSAVTTGYTISFNNSYAANQLVRYLDIVISKAATVVSANTSYIVFSERMDVQYNMPISYTIGDKYSTTSSSVSGYIAASKWGGGGATISKSYTANSTSPLKASFFGASSGQSSQYSTSLVLYEFYDNTYNYITSGTTTGTSTNRKIPTLTVSSVKNTTTPRFLLVLSDTPKERYQWNRGILGLSNIPQSTWTSANTSTYVWITGVAIEHVSSSLSYFKTNFFSPTKASGRWFPAGSGTTGGLMVLLLATNSAGTNVGITWPAGTNNYVYALLGGGLYKLSYTQSDGNTLNNDTDNSIISASLGRSVTLVKTLS